MKKAVLFFTCVFALLANASNLPTSKRATLVEQYNESEVSINATGQGKKQPDAVVDMRKAAVWFVLNGGTDPLLKNDQAKKAFEEIQEDFFKDISEYITWEASKFISTNPKASFKDAKTGKTIKGFEVQRNLRVNHSKIRRDLESKGVLASAGDLAAQIGFPSIMVIPETPKGQTPLEVYNSNPYAVHAAGVIESFLTSRKYDVKVPRAQEQLNDMISIQSELDGVEEDISYQLALALGADVYISFYGSIENNKATVVVKAFETTTARLLGSETGYSAARPGANAQALVEEALNGAIANVLARITSYWQDDAKIGSQYKLILKARRDFSKKEIQDIKFAVGDALDEMFSRVKENIVTDKTMDYLVWAKNSEYSRSSNIYRDLVRKLKPVGVDVTSININNKLIILGLD